MFDPSEKRKRKNGFYPGMLGPAWVCITPGLFNNGFSWIPRVWTKQPRCTDRIQIASNLCCEYSRVIRFDWVEKECPSKETFQVRGCEQLERGSSNRSRMDVAVIELFSDVRLLDSFFFLFFFFLSSSRHFIGTKNRQRQKVQRQWCNRSEGEWGSSNWSWMDRDSSAGRSCVAVCPDLGSKRAPTIGSIRPRGCRTPRSCGDFDCCRFASMRIAGTEKWTVVPQAGDRGRNFWSNLKMLLI